MIFDMSTPTPNNIESLPSVCILLATYNGSAYLEEQLLSLNSLMGAKIDVFLRDDLSSDATLHIIEKIKNSINIQINIIQDNYGRSGSAGSNFLMILDSICINNYDYVAFCDQDDIWLPSKIIRSINMLSEGGFDGYSSNLIAFSEKMDVYWLIKRSYPQKEFDYLFQAASAGCTYVLSKHAARLVKSKYNHARISVNIIPSHDWLIYAICRSHNLKWFSDYQSHILYRQHQNNVFGALSGRAGFMHKWRLARSGWFAAHLRWLWSFIAQSQEETKIYSALIRYSWRDRIWLAVSSHRFRRRRRDQLFLAFCFIMGWI
jgi:rhamnosyltransferase